MGAIKRDMHAGERRLSERYALDNPSGVKLLLSEYHALQERQYQGDVDAIILLADLSTAILHRRLNGPAAAGLEFGIRGGFNAG